ncbi:MAG TPA: ABC transporter substrate-binding protein [Acidobacteriota bacterium]|nr:ABC transporter substrate-binding protein [Acidobacteriota bacterium]
MKKLLPVLLILFVVLQLSCGKQPEKAASTSKPAEYKDPFPIPADAQRMDVTGVHGGRLVTATLADFPTFNTLTYVDDSGQLLNQLMNPGLTELSLETQEPFPALAKSWDLSEDRLTWTFHLRQGLVWSDGQPFNADDVIFTMQVVNDPRISSGSRDALLGGKIQWSRIDDFTLQAKLPRIFVPLLHSLDGGTCAIIPKHKWESVYKQGKFEEAMQVSMDVKDYVTIGPYMIKSYKPAESITLVRNPRYWRIDKYGRRLPYLDEITFLIMPTQDQVFLKIQSGELDTFYSVRAEDVEPLQAKAASIGMKVIKVGPAYDFEGLWFNLNTGRNAKGKPFVDPAKESWFQDVNFRKAVSYAINRDALVQNALFGKGVPSWGPESVGNVKWYNPAITKYPYDPAKALELLKASGFTQKTDSLGKALLYDKKGNPVRFSLHTNSENSIRKTKCTLIASDLAKIGMQVEYSPLEFTNLSTRITKTFDYDAILLGLSHDDVDPSGGNNVWRSSGSLHFWWPGQKKPATEWEKRIDQLMELQQNTYDFAERKKYYDEVQMILTDKLPMIYTATPVIYVCAKEKLGNLQPSIARHRTLWNLYELYWMP